MQKMSEKLLLNREEKQLYPTMGVRLGASLINLSVIAVLLLAVTSLLPTTLNFAASPELNLTREALIIKLLMLFATSGFITFIACGIVIIPQWIKYSTDLGKRFYGIQILDYKTLEKPKTRQFIIRYCCYIFSALTLNFDMALGSLKKDRRNIRDKISGTVLVMPKMIDKEYRSKKIKNEMLIVLGLLLLMIILRRVFGVI
jgi:uncharacterized RDD family membrane protein YckC